MTKIIIAEIPSRIGNFTSYFDLPIDRSQTTVSEYLSQNHVEWRFYDDPCADFRVYKDENLPNGLISLRRLRSEYQKRFNPIPYMILNGEAQEYSRISYLIGDPERTFSVAPGTKYKRLFLPSVLTNPQLETWEERLDRICWIGRPLPERIRLAKKINQLDIGLDLYSRKPWPLPNWKGYAEDEIQISRKYKYRIVFENSLRNLYHSEKLFNGIKSGCVTFYLADPALKLNSLQGAYFACDRKNILERQDIANGALKRIKDVMYSTQWEIYSYKNFFGMIINVMKNSLEKKRWQV